MRGVLIRVVLAVMPKDTPLTLEFYGDPSEAIRWANGSAPASRIIPSRLNGSV